MHTSSAIEGEQGKLRQRIAMDTSCHGSDAIPPPLKSTGIWALFSPKAKLLIVMHCGNHSGFCETNYPPSHLTELHVSSKMRHAKKSTS